jgi:hypothetical protein
LHELGNTTKKSLPFGLGVRKDYYAIKIVQLNFNYEMTGEAVDMSADGFVNPVLEMPGLKWKVGILS